MSRPPRPAAGLWAGLAITATAGLATGVGELGFLAARKYLRGLFVFQPVDVVWTTPLVNAILFGVIALGWVASRRWMGRSTPGRHLAGLGAGLGTLSLLLLFPPLHPAASLVIAGGIGVQVGRIRLFDGPTMAIVARRTLAVAVPVLLIIGIAMQAVPRLRERQALASLGSVSPTGPNVLLIVLDTVRALSLSAYGYDRPTSPRLAARASSGVRFAMAQSTAPWTLPSHASLFTGRQAHDLTTDWYVALDDRDPTLAAAFGKAGYRTAGFVANLPYANRETGLARGFQRYEDWPFGVRQVALSSSLIRAVVGNAWLRGLLDSHDLAVRKRAPDVNRAFLDWVDRDDRPFFAFLNYYDAHTPFVPPEPYRSRFAPAGEPFHPDLDRRTENAPWDAALIRGALNAYDGSIAYLDEHLGRLFDDLEERGLLEQTLVIVTSDHGEEFAEHGLFSHGNSLYLPSLHVPLLLWLPGTVPAGLVVGTPVSISDIPATIAEVTGLATDFPGRPLSRFWGADTAGAGGLIYTEVRHAPKLPAWYPSTIGDLLGVQEGSLRLIRNGDGRIEAYDIAADPAETRDLATDPIHAPAVTRLSRLADSARPPTPPAAADQR